MSYVAPKDYTQDPEIVAKIMRTISGQLELTWMKNIGERAAFRPSQPARGLTLDDINQGSYSPDHLPEIVRHNFSMAPREKSPRTNRFTISFCMCQEIVP